jgi:hypothetical protein
MCAHAYTRALNRHTYVSCSGGQRVHRDAEKHFFLSTGESFNEGDWQMFLMLTSRFSWGYGRS